MARILYIAMSCGPNRGSEDAIGWNLPIAMSRRGNDVFVLTRADKRAEIEAYLDEHPDERGPEYLYIAQSPLAMRMNGPLLSVKVAAWCKKVSKKLPDIVESLRVEVVHQITPIEFRSIIDADLDDVAMFLGPIGGAEEVLAPLASYLKKERLIESLRAWANLKAIRRLERSRTFEVFDGVWCANFETRDFLKQHGIDVGRIGVLTEIGVLDARLESETCEVHRHGSSKRGGVDGELRLAYVGRLVPRKGVDVLLDACSIMKQNGVAFELGIYGDGVQRGDLERKAAELNLSEVEFHGRLPHSHVEKAYLDADVLVMPSIRETGGAVLAEAATYGKPVVAFDAFGARAVLRGSISILVNPAEGAGGLAAAIGRIAASGFPSGKTMHEVAQSLLWSVKANYFQERYRIPSVAQE